MQYSGEYLEGGGLLNGEGSSIFSLTRCTTAHRGGGGGGGEVKLDSTSHPLNFVTIMQYVSSANCPLIRSP